MVETRVSTSEGLLRVGEVARLLRTAESTVRNWIGRDEIPYVVLPGGDYRIPALELFRSLRSNVDVVTLFERLSERLRAVDDEAVDAEIAAVRAGE
jgi:excisionase family DNA binding protein